jgi:hypothetical protein
LIRLQTAYAVPGLGAWTAGGAARNASAEVGPLFFLVLFVPFSCVGLVVAAFATFAIARALPEGLLP